MPILSSWRRSGARATRRRSLFAFTFFAGATSAVSGKSGLIAYEIPNSPSRGAFAPQPALKGAWPRHLDAGPGRERIPDDSADPRRRAGDSAGADSGGRGRLRPARHAQGQEAHRMVSKKHGAVRGRGAGAAATPATPAMDRRVPGRLA